MTKIKRLFRQSGFTAVLLIICYILFNWQYIGISETGHGYTTYSYLFIVWGIVIFLMFLVSRANYTGLSQYSEEEEGDIKKDAEGDIKDV
ncbi:MAG: hypothetical protein L3V56_12065 [Candidatus Magnetoovum sp. WYHC-5]|nr:hypothetical protein [Candidatus Magnetoovum sp. WYHC-5]